jgi:hypothetical protein
MRTLIAAGVVIAGVLVSPAAATGPDETQLFRSVKAPRAGSAFAGAALTVFGRERQENGFREIRFSFARGSVKLKSGRMLRVRVTVTRLPANPDLGGRVESVSICTWLVPAGLTGRRLTSSLTIYLTNADGTTGSVSEPLGWTIR